jgi:hypothetical protein
VSPRLGRDDHCRSRFDGRHLSSCAFFPGAPRHEVQLRDGEELPLGVVLHVRVLPVSATLSDGHRTAPDAWIVPLLTVSKLEILVAEPIPGRSVLRLTLATPEGNVLAEARAVLAVGRRSPDSTARRSVRIGSSQSIATADRSSTRSTRRCAQAIATLAPVGTNDRPSPAIAPKHGRVPPRRLPVLRPWTEATGTGDGLEVVVAQSTKTAPELLDAAVAPRTESVREGATNVSSVAKSTIATGKPSSGSEPSALTGDGRHLAETIVERGERELSRGNVSELVSFCYARQRRAWHALPSCWGPPMTSHL